MIPFRVGDPVVVESHETWFAGAVGQVADVYPESGTIMVRLERWSENGRKVVMEPATLPFAPSEIAPRSCQHPLVNESILRGWLARQEWSEDPPSCPDCGERLYPALTDSGALRVYVGEPKGAGDA